MDVLTPRNHNDSQQAVWFTCMYWKVVIVESNCRTLERVCSHGETQEGDTLSPRNLTLLCPFGFGHQLNFLYRQRICTFPEFNSESSKKSVNDLGNQLNSITYSKYHPLCNVNRQDGPYKAVKYIHLNLYAI